MITWILALVVGIVYLGIRGFAPDILGLEKFMDFGFIRSYMENSGFPTLDPWWAGEKINYYTFGHFLAGKFLGITRIPPGIGYNVILALIFGLSCGLVYLITESLIGKTKKTFKMVLASLTGVFLVMIGGNSHGLWYLIKNRGLTNYWYADQTRFIQNTIHEFPSYSFVVSDLHAHVLSLPMVLSFILLMVFFVQGKRKNLVMALMGVVMGMLLMTNTWDFLVYGILLVVTSGLLLVTRKRKLLELLIGGIAVAIIATAVSAPWWMSFRSISSGIKLVTPELRTPFWQLGVLWIGHFVIVLVAMVLNIKRRNVVIWTLSITAIILIALPEFIYFKDIYPNHQRANTMFKFTYQAFIMLGLVGGWTAFQITQIKNVRLRILATIILVSLMGVFGIFPVKAYPNFYGEFKEFKGLDGLIWVKEKYPDDLKIIGYLEKNKNGKNMIEAIGDSYTEYNYVSAFSGVPTVVGWRVHEWLWRGTYDIVSKREQEVKEVYETKNEARRLELIKKYNLGWIVIGTRERKEFIINTEGIKRVAEKVGNAGVEELWRIR
jgi:uncharacterized membrane protein